MRHCSFVLFFLSLLPLSLPPRPSPPLSPSPSLPLPPSPSLPPSLPLFIDLSPHCQSCFGVPFCSASFGYQLLSVCVCVCKGACEGLAIQAYALGWYENADKKMDSRFNPSESGHICGRRIGYLLPGRVPRSDSSKRRTTRTGSRLRLRLQPGAASDFALATSRSIWKDAPFAWKAMFSGLYVGNHGLIAQLVAMRQKFFPQRCGDVGVASCVASPLTLLGP